MTIGLHTRRLVSVGLVMFLLAATAFGGELPGSSTLRRPVKLVLTRDGNRLFVANGRSGTLSTIDPAASKVIAETEVGRGLADLVALPDGRHALAVDRAGGMLILLDPEAEGSAVKVLDRVAVSPDPVGVCLVDRGDKTLCVVASLWSRRLTFVTLSKRSPADSRPSLSVDGGLDLPFSPGEIVAIGTRVVAADAFGGRLAVVDASRLTLDSVRTLPAHNIRGMALAPDGRSLVLAHQTLNRLATTQLDDVHWGLLVGNHLRVLSVATLLDARPNVDNLDGGTLIDLGDVGQGAGDPAGLAFVGATGLAVALSGVDEVAFFEKVPPGPSPLRSPVGRRPTTVLPSPDGKLLYTANTLDDTISILETKTGRVVGTIALGGRPSASLADLGERLFFDARLSHDGWMSCHSCHSDGHTNNLRSDTLGDGSYGAPKRVPSLLGVAATAPYTWNGSVDGLEEQVRRSIGSTMHGPNLTAEQVDALVAFLRTLRPPSTAVRGIDSSRDRVSRGAKVFADRKCAACHAGPESTSPGRFDVGLVDELGKREFNPPSLRNVGRRDALLHDGRATSLEEVFRTHRHPRGLEMTPGEIEDLTAFLKTL